MNVCQFCSSEVNTVTLVGNAYLCNGCNDLDMLEQPEQIVCVDCNLSEFKEDMLYMDSANGYVCCDCLHIGVDLGEDVDPYEGYVKVELNDDDLPF